MGRRVRDVIDTRTLGAFHQHLHGAVGKLQKLQDIGDRADLVDGFRRRIVVAGVDLGNKHDLLVGAHDFLERTDGFFPPDEQGNDHMRENDNVAQGKYRIGTARCRRRDVRHIISFPWSLSGHFAERLGGVRHIHFSRLKVEFRNTDFKSSEQTALRDGRTVKFNKTQRWLILPTFPVILEGSGTGSPTKFTFPSYRAANQL